MIEKLKKVSNPLTAVCVFAGIAEVALAVTLPRLKGDIQLIFAYFAIGFPILLLVLFFVTLNFNRKALYAPSDFSDETNFIKLLIKKEIEESPKISNIEEDIRPLVRQSLEDDAAEFSGKPQPEDTTAAVDLKSHALEILRILKNGRWVYRSAGGLAKEALGGKRNLAKDTLFELKEKGLVGERVRREGHWYYITDEGRRLLHGQD